MVEVTTVAVVAMMAEITADIVEIAADQIAVDLIEGDARISGGTTKIIENSLGALQHTSTRRKYLI